MNIKGYQFQVHYLYPLPFPYKPSRYYCLAILVTLGGIHCLAGTLVDKVEHGHSILANVTILEPNGEFVVRDIDDADGVTRFGLSLRALVRERQSLA